MSHLHNALERLGTPVRTIDESDFSARFLEDTIDAWRPDLVITNNFDFLIHHMEGESIERILRRHGIPAISWFFESPETYGGSHFLTKWQDESYPKYFRIATTDTARLSFFRSFGLDCFYFPMGVAQEAANFCSNLSVKNQIFYSGDPSIPEFLRSDSDENLKASVIDWMLRDFNFMLSGQLALSFLVELRSELNFLFDEVNSFGPNFKKNRVHWTEKKLNTFPDRVSLSAWKLIGPRIDIGFSVYQLILSLRHLSKHLPMEIHGSLEWNRLIPGLRNQSRRLTFEELYRSFGESLMTICMTKHNFINFVHERVWMVLACGGLPLTDDRSDLWNFFERGDLPVYSHIDEIPDLYRFYFQNSSDRTRLIEKGRGMVLKDHTYDSRAKTLVDEAASMTGLVKRA